MERLIKVNLEMTDKDEMRADFEKDLLKMGAEMAEKITDPGKRTEYGERFEKFKSFLKEGNERV